MVAIFAAMEPDQAGTIRYAELAELLVSSVQNHPRLDATALHAAHQLLDTAIVAAGLMDDARTMIPRLNKLLELALLKQDK